MNRSIERIYPFFATIVFSAGYVACGGNSTQEVVYRCDACACPDGVGGAPGAGGHAGWTDSGPGDEDGGPLDATTDAPECESGKQRCNGGVPQICSDAGEWQDQPPCQAATTCSVGQCVPYPMSVRFALGEAHSCGLTAWRGALCWGDNGLEQLGTGVPLESYAPSDVVGLESGVLAVAAGRAHTCALLDGGGVKCWGVPAPAGQTGDEPIAKPTDVVGIGSKVVAIAAGGDHTCAVTDGGGVKCWGANESGALGDGTNADSPAPVDVVGLSSGVVLIGVGAYHSCAVMAQGGVRCWGANHRGQLGNDTTVSSNVPVEVIGLSQGVAALSGGWHHTCAVTSDGAALCWGGNQIGQLGNGSILDQYTPAPVLELSSGVRDIAAGNLHTCALKHDGSVKCWGVNNNGTLGVPGTGGSQFPLDLAGVPSGATAIHAGNAHNCVITENEGLWCWGTNVLGQLGINSFEDLSYEPVRVAGF